MNTSGEVPCEECWGLSVITKGRRKHCPIHNSFGSDRRYVGRVYTKAGPRKRVGPSAKARAWANNMFFYKNGRV